MAVGNSLARFAYARVLPAMRDDLGWSYTEAGALNTINAIGYLAVAVLAVASIRRLGPKIPFIVGLWVTAITVLATAFVRDFAAIAAIHALTGIAAAYVFVTGGVLAANVFPGTAGRGGVSAAPADALVKGAPHTAGARPLAAWSAGRPFAAVMATVGIGAALPLAGGGLPVVIASALLFGCFFMVPAAVTAFIKVSLPAMLWGEVFAAFTLVFSVLQCFGPAATGVLADLTGSLAAGLGISAGILLLGALAGPAQRPVA